MRDVAAQAYEECQIGAVGWIRPGSQTTLGLQEFQAVKLAVDAMQADGVICVLQIHKETQSGKSLIDAIQFQRVR